ncbi:hypothetical protein Q5752_006914 [Cryptotrichosporon argae]
MTSSNPSHLLISRNPRSPAHPQLAASTHAHPASLFAHRRSRSVPSLTAGERGAPGSGSGAGSAGSSDAGADEDEADIEVHETFQPDVALRGSVKVVVGRHAFWCHKDVLWFASPFFRALLEGNWAETAPMRSRSPTDTDVPSAPYGQPVPTSTDPLDDEPRWTDSDATESDTGGQSKQTSVYLDAAEGPSVAEILRELRELPDAVSVSVSVFEHAAHVEKLAPAPSEGDWRPAAEHPARPKTPSTPSFPFLLAPQSSLPLPPTVTTQSADASPSGRHRTMRSADGTDGTASAGRRDASRRMTHRASTVYSLDPPDCAVARGDTGAGIDALVELKEEDAGAFQDFLFWAYPHLECKVSWTNVEPLLALACKLLVPALQKLCVHFLLTHASGRPVVALKLAELHDHAELYREASRFVLDQAAWERAELETLSGATRLKLSQRRTWFLERLLKLGAIDVRKEYACRPECASRALCQQQLDDKWRHAHSAVSRFGPPQPSVAYRCLRQLETFPTNPSLGMPHPACQATAKAWVATLFDRMFAPKSSVAALSPGTEKYWLYITLD